MNVDDFKNLIEDFFKKNCIDLMCKVKQKEYARGGDKLHNFKKAGRRRGKSPIEALAGMGEKHYTSIDDMIQDLEKQFQKDGDIIIERKDLVVWEEKLRDAINYYFLLWALLNEAVLVLF